MYAVRASATFYAAPPSSAPREVGRIVDRCAHRRVNRGGASLGADDGRHSGEDEGHDAVDLDLGVVARADRQMIDPHRAVHRREQGSGVVRR